MSDDRTEVLNDEERRRFWRLAALPLGLAACAYLGQILSATLVSRVPIALIALAPADAFLILTVNEVPAWSFFAVGFVRLVLPDPMLYSIGYHFGPAAKSYLDSELGRNNMVTRAVTVLDRWFPRAGMFIVFALPNYPVCLLSGMTRMRAVPFAILNVTGTATRLYVIWRLGRLFSGPAERVLGWITRYQLPFTAAMIALVLIQLGTRRRDE